MCAARASEIYERQAKERMKAGGGDKTKEAGMENLPSPVTGQSTSRDAAGKAFGVSGKSVDFAKRVIDKGIKFIEPRSNFPPGCYAEPKHFQFH